MLPASFTAAAVVLLAVVLFAWEAGRRPREPRLAALALVLLLFGIGLHLTASGFADGLVHLLVSSGAGLIAASVVLAARKLPPRAFFVLGIGAIVLAGLLRVAIDGLRGSAAPAEAPTFLVELGPDDTIDELAGVLERFHAQYEPAFPTIPLHLDEDLAQTYLIFLRDARDGEALLDALRADSENVDFAEPNRLMGLEPPPAASAPAPSEPQHAIADDPLAGQQWALDLARGHGAHALLQQAQPVRKARVAIVDTGVDGAHEDLATNFIASPGETDGNGHGTHCAGIAGAATNNGLGVASLNWEGRFVDVAGYHALGPTGIGTMEQIAQAIIDAAQDGADVISLSLGDTAPIPPRVLGRAVAFAHEQGAIVIASAGNSNQDATHHVPSNMPGVIAVAAVDHQGRKARFSNTIATMTRPIAAPGVDVMSLLPKNGYGAKSGTSMAAPFVSGLVGVMRALAPDLTSAEAYAILHATGTDVDETPQIGRVVNAEAAIEQVLARTPVPAASRR